MVVEVEKLELLRRDLDSKLIRKGKEVEHFSLFVHYHPWRFSVSGTHCEEYEIKIEVAVSRFVNTRRGHSRGRTYGILVMGVACDEALTSTPKDRVDLRKILLQSLSQTYNVSENRIIFPSDTENEGNGENRNSNKVPFYPSSPRYFANTERCTRAFCKGIILPDIDDRLRCIICGRYKDDLQVT